MKILSRLHDLLLKTISVKGAFFIAILVLVSLGFLSGEYAFIAGSYWVGARELYKHFGNKVAPKKTE